MVEPEEWRGEWWIATAAENIHHALRSRTPPLAPGQFESLKERLDSALTDEPDDVRAFVRNRLHNTANYRDWLLDLAAIPEAAVVDELLTDRERWATMLRRARNDLAHADERSAASAETSAAFWLLEVTYALLHLVLLTELGLDAEQQRKALGPSQDQLGTGTASQDPQPLIARLKTASVFLPRAVHGRPLRSSLTRT